MPVYHLVAHPRGYRRLLLDDTFARRTWVGLRRAFPDAIAANLMPDHVHVGEETDDPDEARRRMSRALARAAHRRGRGTWDPVPEPELVREPKLRRFVRYVALNPCRDGLASDPLAWTWSTYRDVMGASADPWGDGRRLARRLGYHPDDFRREFHRYCSSDATVSLTGTSLPLPAPPVENSERSIVEIHMAVAAALRCSPEDLAHRGKPRQLLLALARHQGWTDANLLAELCSITPRAVRKTPLAVSTQELDAALLCLGDDRLLRAPDSTFRPLQTLETNNPRSSSRGPSEPRWATNDARGSFWRNLKASWLGGVGG